MKYLNFDTNRPFDLILLGRVAIDLNPAVSEGFKPLKNVSHFENMLAEVLQILLAESLVMV